MATQVQICNMALSRLGAATITNITDNTAEAILCNTFFDQLADEVMIQGSWTSTIKRAVLNKTTTTPTFEFSNEFQLPTDPFALKVLNINEDCRGNTPFKIEGDKLLSDESAVSIRYIGRLTDTEDWDTSLTHAFRIFLQAHLSIPISGDRGEEQRLMEEYSRLVTRNLAINGQQGSKDKEFVNDLINVR